MNRYGELADELTDMIEEMEAPGRREEARVLVRHLQRAFQETCMLDRQVRHRALAKADASAPVPAEARVEEKVRAAG